MMVNKIIGTRELITFFLLTFETLENSNLVINQNTYNFYFYFN